MYQVFWVSRGNPTDVQGGGFFATSEEAKSALKYAEEQWEATPRQLTLDGKVEVMA